MPTECIDAHHHLWRYSAGDYPWMSDEMEGLRHDYLLRELAKVTEAVGVTGTVAVQARQSTAETDWLLDIAESSDLIRGVVGWAPLVDEDVESYLAEVSPRQKLKAMRHVLHDEPDANYVLRDDFNRGISCLRKFNLRYDLLIREQHLPQTIEFVDRHPNQVFIVDHIAKPRIGERLMQPWAANLRELGRRSHVYCKLSGMVTEADWNAWNEAQLQPYIETVLSIFGAGRVMFGSDWPVLNVASDYGSWIDLVRRSIGDLSSGEQQRILAGTATEAYGL